jgi:hypothetical protein
VICPFLQRGALLEQEVVAFVINGLNALCSPVAEKVRANFLIDAELL